MLSFVRLGGQGGCDRLKKWGWQFSRWMVSTLLEQWCLRAMCALLGAFLLHMLTGDLFDVLLRGLGWLLANCSTWRRSQVFKWLNGGVRTL